MDMLSRKQTPVYNQALYVLRSGYFWWKYLEPGWRDYYMFKGSLHLSFHDLRDMMRWFPVYRDAIPTCAMNAIQRVHDAWRAWEKSTRKFNACKAPVKLYPRRIDGSINEIRKKSPDIFGCNGVGARHHPKPVCFPVQS